MVTSTFNPSFFHLGRFALSRKVSPSVLSKKFELHCSIERDMDVRPSVLVDGVPKSLNGMESNKEPSVSTILLNFENPFDPYGASSTPLYQTATFKQVMTQNRHSHSRIITCSKESTISVPFITMIRTPSITALTGTENGLYDYTRIGNPTRDVLESLIGQIVHFALQTGMAALATVTHLVETGQEIVAGDDIYGGSDRLLSHVLPGKGVVVKARLLLSQPLKLGADIVMHSATKFISGYADVMAGVLAVKGESFQVTINHICGSVALHISWLKVLNCMFTVVCPFTSLVTNSLLTKCRGGCISSFDCWILAGIKTMSSTEKVNYAGLPGHPGSSLHYSQLLMGSVALSRHIVEATKYLQHYRSVKSLISMPCFMSHAKHTRCSS
ncbi:hypothetical protein MKW92_013307 [Papaver armeniacum]|nr:hypothetical protein MKW92_013307 [Papaver armeniacum]